MTITAPITLPATVSISAPLTFGYLYGAGDGGGGGGPVDWGDIEDTPTTLSGYGITDAASDGELNDGLAGKANSSHTHAQSDVTGLVYDLAAKASASDLSAHTGNTSNPHSVTKSQVGLGNADNTSDANKPISTATQTALDLKAPLASPSFTGPFTATATGSDQIALSADNNVTLTSGSTLGLVATGSGKVAVTGAFQVTLGSDATGDIYYRNSGGTISRLPAGSNGNVLTLASGIPSWGVGGGGSVSISGTPATGQFAKWTNPSTIEGVSTIALAGGTVTSSTPMLDMTQTWNSGGTTFTGWKLNVTNTASAAASALIDLQVGGTSQFTVGRTGTVTAGDGTGFNFAGINIRNGSGTPNIQVNGTAVVGLTSTRTNVPGLGMGSAVTSSPDVILERDAAANLALRNGTNAQTFRVYNTYTSSTNHERFKVEWASNVVKVGTEKGSSGTARDMEFQTDGTTRVTLSAAGVVSFAAAPVLPPFTVATVPSASTYARGIIYVSDETGGAVIAFSDGTNWRRLTDRNIVS